ncbi:MAG TPA: cobalamin B12-binding domain-containing protein, partial [Lachnospiraceae bacterium]|nr:cobalamin B12-binding domain-containing protein [Lachnospiraceae bacterium]
MKVLLTAINAKYIHSNLAVYSLKAYARNYAEHIELAEFTINHYSDYIIQELYKRKPDILALSCYIWNIELVEEVAKELHKLLPKMKIWLGGPEVTY